MAWNFENVGSSGIYNPRGIGAAWLKPMLAFPWRLMRDREYRRFNAFHYKLRKKPRFQPGEIRYEKGLPIRYADARSFLSAFDEIFVNGIYDIGDVEGTPYFIDAGANIGLASLYWTRRYPGCEGIAFEPDPQIFEVLQKNLTAWDSSIRPVCAALGKREGKMAFSIEGADAGRLGHLPALGSGSTAEVDVVRLSEHLDRPVDLLKLDIEGAELEVMREIESRLGNLKHLFVEAHSFNAMPQDYGELIHLIQDAGFRCNLQVATTQWRGFVRRAGLSDMDLNLNIYGVREEKNV